MFFLRECSCASNKLVPVESPNFLWANQANSIDITARHTGLYEQKTSPIVIAVDQKGSPAVLRCCVCFVALVIGQLIYVHTLTGLVLAN